MPRPVKSAVNHSTANSKIQAVADFDLVCAPQPNGEKHPGAEKIFVVDDEYFARKHISTLLQDDGWDVEIFSSCEDFLAAYQRRPNTCVVLDMHFPGMSGLELLRRLREVEDRSQVIVLSGSSDVSEAVQAMKRGVFDFIQKPVSCDQLTASVARALALARRSDQITLAREAAIARFKTLTTRQKQITALVLAGHPSKNIAVDLCVSQRTVESHRAAIMKRTGSRSLPELARLAVSIQWTPDR